MNDIINKVADSGLISLDLEEFYPKDADIAVFDFTDYLFMGLILKEKDFRFALQNLDLSLFENKYVAVTCSTDAIIPMWANMLVVSTLNSSSYSIFFGNKNLVKESILLSNLNKLDASQYLDKRIVVKGCGDLQIPESAYITVTSLLLPYVKSIMYGEPCSTVPIYKKK